MQKIANRKPSGGEAVVVLSGNAFDEPVDAQPRQVVAGLVHAVVDAAEQSGQARKYPVWSGALICLLAAERLLFGIRSRRSVATEVGRTVRSNNMRVTPTWALR